MGKVDPVGEILGVLDLEQLTYWRAFLDLEPLPADRDDTRAALHTALIGNRLAWSDETEALQPSELIVDWEAASEPAPVVDPVAEADALVLAINSRFRV